LVHRYILQELMKNHSKNELPTCTKILDVVNADNTLPELKRTTLWKVLKILGFKWERRSRKNVLIERQDIRSRKNVLIERQDIILWRRRYLNSIRKFRSEVKSEKLPTATWKKDALVNWLLSKGILCDNTQLKSG
ncbi:hypothetical protein QE152_g8470, partial [Popillia japonica]